MLSYLEVFSPSIGVPLLHILLTLAACDRAKSTPQLTASLTTAQPTIADREMNLHTTFCWRWVFRPWAFELEKPILCRLPVLLLSRKSRSGNSSEEEAGLLFIPYAGEAYGLGGIRTRKCLPSKKEYHVRDTNMKMVCASCKVATEATTWAPVMGHTIEPYPEPVSLGDSCGTIDNQRVKDTRNALKKNHTLRAKKAQLKVRPKYSSRF